MKGGSSIAKDATEIVGNTPMVYLDKIGKGLPGRIAAKVEYCNPTCSIKDRTGWNMINEAEKAGILIPGKSVIVESTSGNTGISMAQIGAVKGYRVIVVMHPKASLERRALMRAFGAELVLLKPDETSVDAVARSKALAEAIPNAVFMNQFFNATNPMVHYTTTGPEIWEQTEGKVDAVVFGIGTGGTVSGVGKFLKEKKPSVQVFGVEPSESSVVNGHPMGRHMIEGIGAGIIPGVLDVPLMDECIRIKSEDAHATSLRLAREEGLMVGISSGANVAAAVQIASKPENNGKLIVTSLADFGERYMSSPLYKGIFDEVSAFQSTTLEENLEKFGNQKRDTLGG